MEPFRQKKVTLNIDELAQQGYITTNVQKVEVFKLLGSCFKSGKAD